ncbi:hypothetical protein ACFQHV_03955 [Promicromonospora thailandica]|uniref:Uncharacterized protein n=1 Tax=Promicromonospora thailandica TaxID=765201 RepID=A0A9X2JWL7_9MICO|nr:hypothetical protein [Promicromonospora thailandica]MCP2265682.1 hypothetical protein [Promicromonospora thailandica]BFF21689.1 hypothetical protein GCM10025730_52100 [Promicromonospora thailandica]
MTAQHPPARPAPAPIPWGVVGGLAALSLLWPLTGLTGLFGTGAPRAFLIIGVTAAVWIGVVGLGRVPRPVLTLTLTGVAYGLVAALIAAVVPALSGFGGPGAAGAPAWTLVPALVVDGLWGALAGVVAAGVQRLGGRR